MFRNSHGFDKLLDRATNKLTPDVDMGALVELNDLITTDKCTPNYAVTAIAKKLRSDNQHVVYKSLLVLDSIVKTVGARMYKEVSSDRLIHAVAMIAKTADYSNSRTKALELIQVWNNAFGKLPEYNNIKEMYILLKSEGLRFPPVSKQTAALFEAPPAEIIPEMREVKNCYRCRTEFSFLVKKHRCDKCGNIFCAKCTSNKVKISIKGRRDKNGKICDICIEKLGKERSEPSQEDSFEADLKLAMQASIDEYKKHHDTSAKVGATEKSKKELEQEEKEQLELAIALSKSEAEEKQRKAEQAKKKATPSSPSTSKDLPSASAAANNSHTVKSEDEDPMLSRYLDRSYWETRHSSYQTGLPSTSTAPSEFQPSAPVEMRSEKDDTDKFASNLHDQVELFVNRMKSNSSRGRHISNDSTVQSLFSTLIPMHNELIGRVRELDMKRGHFENLQDKMTQIKEARHALDELRNEYQEQKQRAAAEQKYMSKVQMQHKLMELRQQKQVFLRTQEERAIRQIQQEELQLLANSDQQRMSANPFSSVMQVPNMMPQSQPPPQFMYTGPQMSLPYAQPPQSYMYMPMPNNAQVPHLPQDHGQGQVNMIPNSPMPPLDPTHEMFPSPTTNVPHEVPQTSFSLPHVTQTRQEGPMPSSNSEPVVRSSEVSPGTSEILSSDSAHTGTVKVQKEPSTEQLISFD